MEPSSLALAIVAEVRELCRSITERVSSYRKGRHLFEGVIFSIAELSRKIEDIQRRLESSPDLIPTGAKEIVEEVRNVLQGSWRIIVEECSHAFPGRDSSKLRALVANARRAFLAKSIAEKLRGVEDETNRSSRKLESLMLLLDFTEANQELRLGMNELTDKVNQTNDMLRRVASSAIFLSLPTAEGSLSGEIMPQSGIPSIAAEANHGNSPAVPVSPVLDPLDQQQVADIVTGESQAEASQNASVPSSPYQQAGTVVFPPVYHASQSEVPQQIWPTTQAVHQHATQHHHIPYAVSHQPISFMPQIPTVPISLPGTHWNVHNQAIQAPPGPTFLCSCRAFTGPQLEELHIAHHGNNIVLTQKYTDGSNAIVSVPIPQNYGAQYNNPHRYYVQQNHCNCNQIR